MSKGKTNPNRRPVSYRDIKEARVAGAEFMFTVIIHILKDKLGLKNEELLKIGPHIDYFCDSIRRGYVKYDDLRKAQLDEGYSVHIKG